MFSVSIFTLNSWKLSCVKPCLSLLRPTPHITWAKDGEDLQVTSRMKVKNFNKMIQIPKASFEDAGEYTCTAKNRLGYAEHTITVRVKGEFFRNIEYFMFGLIIIIQTNNIFSVWQRLLSGWKNPATWFWHQRKMDGWCVALMGLLVPQSAGSLTENRLKVCFRRSCLKGIKMNKKILCLTFIFPFWWGFFFQLLHHCLTDRFQEKR